MTARVAESDWLGRLDRPEVAAGLSGKGHDVVVADALYASAAVDITAQVLTALQSKNRAPAPAAKP